MAFDRRETYCQSGKLIAGRDLCLIGSHRFKENACDQSVFLRPDPSSSRLIRSQREWLSLYLRAQADEGDIAASSPPLPTENE